MGAWGELLTLIVSIIEAFIILIGIIKVFDWLLCYKIAPWVRKK